MSPESIDAVAGAADRAERRRLLGELRRLARQENAAPATLDRLLKTPPHGPLAAAEWLAHEPGPLPRPLWGVAHAVAADAGLPLAHRLAATGRLIDAIGDNPQAVRRAVSLVTEGCSTAQAVRRVLQLGRYVESSEALDQFSVRLQRETKIRCPRCREAVSMWILADHLYAEHGLFADSLEPVTPEELVAPLINSAATGAAAALELAAATVAVAYPEAPPTQLLQAISAQQDAPPEAIAVLLEDADEQHAGLCPNCLACVPDPVAVPPPDLSLSPTRIAGEGFAAEVVASWRGDSVVLSTPAGGLKRVPWRSAGSRRWASLAAALLTLASALALPVAVATVTVMAGVVTVVLLNRGAGKRGPTDASGELLELVWQELTAGIGRSAEATRFLTRLCRTSFRTPGAEGRGSRVRELAEQFAVLTQTRDRADYALLFANVRVLTAVQSLARGVEPATVFRPLFAPVWQGNASARDLELLSEAILASGALAAVDRLRLGHLLAEDALAAGLTPYDFGQLGELLPSLPGLVPVNSLRHLDAVRRHPERRVGRTVAELALGDVKWSRQLLKTVPDALWVAEVPGVTAVLSDRGLMLNSRFVDVTAPVGVSGSTLTVGDRAFALTAGSQSADTLKAAVAFARQVFERAGDFARSARGTELFNTLLVDCPVCGERSAVRRGRLGLVRVGGHEPE